MMAFPKFPKHKFYKPTTTVVVPKSSEYRLTSSDLLDFKGVPYHLASCLEEVLLKAIVALSDTGLTVKEIEVTYDNDAAIYTIMPKLSDYPTDGEVFHCEFRATSQLFKDHEEGAIQMVVDQVMMLVRLDLRS
jgi:hypothetical protein